MDQVFICVDENEERAIYYSYQVGRRRNYRSSYPKPSGKTFRLKDFKKKENAQKLADFTNEEFGDNFKVIAVSKDFVKNCKI